MQKKKPHKNKTTWSLPRKHTDKEKRTSATIKTRSPSNLLCLFIYSEKVFSLKAQQDANASRCSEASCILWGRQRIQPWALTYREKWWKSSSFPVCWLLFRCPCAEIIKARISSQNLSHKICVQNACTQVRFKVLIHDWRTECGPYGLYILGYDWNAHHVDPPLLSQKTALHWIPSGIEFDWLLKWYAKKMLRKLCLMILKSLHALEGRAICSECHKDLCS